MFSVLLQLTVQSFVISKGTAHQSVRQSRSRQTLGDHKWIIAQGVVNLGQDTRLFAIARHAVHLGLELLRSNRFLPIVFERL